MRFFVVLSAPGGAVLGFQCFKVSGFQCFNVEIAALPRGTMKPFNYSLWLSLPSIEDFWTVNIVLGCVVQWCP